MNNKEKLCRLLETAEVIELAILITSNTSTGLKTIAIPNVKQGISYKIDDNNKLHYFNHSSKVFETISINNIVSIKFIF